MDRPLMLICALGVVATLGGGCARVQTLDRATIETVTLAELRAEPDKFAEQLAALSSGAGGVILALEAGDELPLELVVEHPLLTVEAGSNTVRFRRAMYLYVSAAGLLISPDGERWARIQDIDTWKELFGDFAEGHHGQLSVGLGVDADRAAVTVAIRDE